MRRLALGIIGHVDHGKTALVRALTGIDTDRLPEEKKRGISIVLGFAHFDVDGVEVDIIDMPGHERFVRTMVSGATGINAVVLVVAADEGIKPQTVEHVNIAALLGIRDAVIVVSKSDLAGIDRARAVGAEAEALVRRSGVTASEAILASAVTKAGIDDVRQAIAQVLRTGAAPEDCGYPYLPVDRVFSVAGHGTVVTGTLRRGLLAVGDELTLAPGGLTARVRRLQIHGQTVGTAEPGQRVAVNLRGVETGQVRRGDALVRPHVLSASSWLTVELRTVPEAPALKSGANLRLLFGTQEAAVRLRLLDSDEARPGSITFAQLRCREEAFIPAREHFILRTASPALTVAGGRVLDPGSSRLRRCAPAVIERLAALAAADAQHIVKLLIAQSKTRGVSLDRLAQVTGLSQGVVGDIVHGLPAFVTKGRTVVAQAVLESVLQHVLRVLADKGDSHAKGMSRHHLAEILPDVSREVLDEAVAKLAVLGRLQQEGGFLRVPRPSQERKQAEQEAALAARVAEAIRQGGLQPPTITDVLPGRSLQKIVERLVREGVLIRTIDRVQKREVLFHRDAIAAAQRFLVPMLDEDHGLLVKEIGAALGISRKYSVPLLEYFDAIQFTRRIGDRRVLGRSR